MDLRTLRLNGVFKGNTGSIRDIAMHPTMNVVATVGLDRIMRVFDTESRQQLHRVYLRQRLNCVLFSSEESVQCFAKEEESEEEDEEKPDDDIEEESEEDEEKPEEDAEEDEEKPEEDAEESDSDDSMLHDDDNASGASDEELEEDSMSD